MTRFTFAVLVTLAGVAGPLPAAAAPAPRPVPMTGRFLAEVRCPALVAPGETDNPGAVTTEPGTSYELLGRNADPTTHYYVAMPGAEPARRWIAIGCGRVEPETTAALG